MNNQVKLIDAGKLLVWIEENKRHYFDSPEVLEAIEDMVESEAFDPDTLPVPTIKPGDGVKHEIYGNGIALSGVVTNPTVQVDFDTNTFTVPVKDLEVVE